MNEIENLLVTLSGECAEISEAVSKSLRFGLNNHHPDVTISNADQIMKEYYQLSALIEQLQSRAYLPRFDDDKIKSIKIDKISNVEKWKDISFKEGTLNDITVNKPIRSMKLIHKSSIMEDEYYCEFTKELDELCGFKIKYPDFHNYLLDTRDEHNNSLDLRVPGTTTGYIKMNDENMIIECKIIDDMIGEGNIYPSLINEWICQKFIGTIVVF